MKQAKEGENIKINIKGYLLNKEDNTKKEFATTCLKNKDIYKYIYDKTIYTLDLTNKSKIIFIRENDDIYHKMIFSNKIEKTEYYLKKMKQTIIITILHTQIEINNNCLQIQYQLKETNDKYVFLIELGEKI